MLADVFLYGRTKTHDYFDMYIPSWMKSDSEEYREYRKTVSYIMKIRDILPENKLGILERTSDSFIFYRGRSISMLAGFCHICGSDEFGRPICSTGGFIFRNEDLKNLWKLIPDMICMLSDSGIDLYRDYSEKYGGESKPESVNRSEEILPGKYPSVSLGQFAEMKDAVNRAPSPFSFAYGPEEKSLYDYSSSDVKISVFFASDECTELTFDEPEEKTADTSGLVSYAEIRKSPQGRLRYRIVMCSEEDNRVLYESYEREAGSEIKLSELFRMYSSVCRYLAEHGTGKDQVRKCIPFDSDTDDEYTGNEIRLEYRPPAEQKRSLIQMIKGVKLPDFSEYIFVRKTDSEDRLKDNFEIRAAADDSTARLVSYEKLMEAAD